MEYVDILEQYYGYKQGKRKFEEIYEKVNKLLNVIAWYLEVYDIEFSTESSLLFHRLYIDRKNKTFFEIACEYFIDIKTLYNYRKRFNKLLLKLLHTIKCSKLIGK